MATISTGLDLGDTLDWRRFDFGSLLSGHELKTGADEFSVGYRHGSADHFSGHGLKYGRDGMIESGTITTFRAVFHGETAWKFEGLKLDAGLLARAAATEKRSDDRALIARMLSGDDRFVGGSGDDHLAGFDGHDRLIGGKGDDWLSGGGGRDTLMGGVGFDTFLFEAKLDAKSNVDVITDFRSGRDTIALENSVFKGLEVGDRAVFGDFILYDQSRHDLYFDRDGTFEDTYKPVKFAHLAGGGTLVADDFVVV